MRYAIFSDVHANQIAWRAVLHDIRQRGADVLVCLGDVVGYGPKPMEVLDGIRAVTGNILMGNHEAAAIGAMDCSMFNEQARHSTEWTTQSLTNEARQFISEFPLSMKAEGIYFVHAEVCEPGEFNYINGPGEALENFLAGDHPVTFIGHTHHPKLFEWDGVGEVLEFPGEHRTLDPAKRYIVNVGSVGEPRNPEDLRASYVIYDAESRLVEFHAVEFDIAAYRNDLEQTTLGVKPYFLQLFEHSVAEGQDRLIQEAPASRLLLPVKENVVLKRMPGAVASGSAVLRKQALVSAGTKKGSWGMRILLILCLLSIVGGTVWIVKTKQGSGEATAAGEDSPSTEVSEPGMESQVASPAEDAASPKLADLAPKIEPPGPTVGKKVSNPALEISPVMVGDTVPSLDPSYGTLELAYNFGYSGEALSQDGISFESISHGHVPAPIYGTTKGITVKGVSSGDSPDFNVADLGDDLWQTISYTDRGDGLQLEITGLTPAKAYQIQILLGEPRNEKWTRYENGLITVIDSSGASQETRLTFGNEDGDYALLTIEVSQSDALLFDMPKATLGPGVAGIVIHSASGE